MSSETEYSLVFCPLLKRAEKYYGAVLPPSLMVFLYIVVNLCNKSLLTKTATARKTEGMVLVGGGREKVTMAAMQMQSIASC